jgi:predicted MFS family arabinose efflux permease
MPKIAAEQFAMEGWRYTLLFSTFGLGAFVGAISMGSWLARYQRPAIVKAGLALFSVALVTFSFAGNAWIGFPAVFVAGVAYFVVVTALITILQLRVHDEVRGRVMGLWMMAWAGLVPVGGLIGGVVVDAVGMTAVLAAGAGVSLLLAIFVNLREPVIDLAVEPVADASPA